MKKRISPSNVLIISTVCIAFGLISAPAGAQETTIQSPFAGLSSQSRYIESNVRLHEIEPAAYAHFQRNFPGISGEFWLKSNKGYEVRFVENGSSSVVTYDKRGRFLYAVRPATFEEIDANVQKSILHHYPGYTVDLVSRVSDEEQTVWFLSMNKNNSVVSIRVDEDGWFLIDNLVYAGL